MAGQPPPGGPPPYGGQPSYPQPAYSSAPSFGSYPQQQYPQYQQAPPQYQQAPPQYQQSFPPSYQQQSFPQYQQPYQQPPPQYQQPPPQYQQPPSPQYQQPPSPSPSPQASPQHQQSPVVQNQQPPSEGSPQEQVPTKPSRKSLTKSGPSPQQQQQPSPQQQQQPSPQQPHLPLPQQQQPPSPQYPYPPSPQYQHPSSPQYQYPSPQHQQPPPQYPYAPHNPSPLNSYPSMSAALPSPSHSHSSGQLDPYSKPGPGGAPPPVGPSSISSSSEEDSQDKYSKKQMKKVEKDHRCSVIENSSVLLEKLKSCDEIDEDAGFEVHYRYILNDPRFVRFRRKFCPDLLSREKAKTIVDPANIPWIGLGVKGYRVSQMAKKHEEVKQISSDDLDLRSAEGLKHMQTGMNEETATRTTDFGVDVVLSVSTALVPGTDLLTQAATTVVPMVAPDIAAAATGGAVVALTDKKVGDHNDAAIQKSIHNCFAATKAFFMYLGYPETDDDMYKRWEKSRIKLKKCYQAEPDEDLYLQKPTKDQEKQIEEMKKETGNFDLKVLKVSLLWIFWRIYDCWNIVYYDWSLKKIKTSGLAKSSKEEFVKKQRQKERSADIAYLEKTFSTSDDRVLQIHSTRAEEALKMLCFMYKDHPRFHWLTKAEPENEGQERLRHYLSVILKSYFEGEQVWAYQDTDAQLLAIALVEPLHHKKAKLGAFSSRSIKSKKYGPALLKTLKEYRENEKGFRTEATDEKEKIRVIPFIGAIDDITGEQALSNLLKAIADQDAYPTLGYESTTSDDWVHKIWEEGTFTPSKKKYNFFTARFVAMWHRPS